MKGIKIKRHTVADVIHGEAKANTAQKFLGVETVFGVVEIGIRDIVANSPEIAFKNRARSGFVNVADASFVLFNEVGGGGEAVVERFGGRVIFKKFVDEVFNHGLE